MVVRHAHAVSRRDWEDDDRWRMLSPKGEKQARLLVDPLLARHPTRILSSPYRRCIDTVSPLALAAGLRVEEDDRLAEGAGRGAVELVRVLAAAGTDAALCSHGDVIPDILATLAHEDRVDLGPAPQVEKASVWVLHGDRGRIVSAEYWRPPKV